MLILSMMGTVKPSRTRNSRKGEIDPNNRSARTGRPTDGTGPASAIGVLGAIGIYLLLRARSFDVILGMTFLSYATNLLIFSGGRTVTGKAPC